MIQSKYVHHIYSDIDFYNFLDYYGDELDIKYDNRNKIEDLDKYLYGLRDVLDEANLSKVEEYTRNFIKFNND